MTDCGQGQSEQSTAKSVILMSKRFCSQEAAQQRIRIDRVSVANHDLIRLLNKPGVSAYSVYKEISFFELGVGSAF